MLNILIHKIPPTGIFSSGIIVLVIIMDLRKIRKRGIFRYREAFLIIWIIFNSSEILLQAQNSRTPSTDSLTIADCIRYAMHNQPLVKQLRLDEDITRQNIRIALADWLPQVNSTAGLSHYLKQPVFLFPDISNPAGPKILIPNGVLNNSNISFSATWNILDNDVLAAGRSAGTYRTQSAETTKSALISLVVAINKAFYDVLLSREQINLIDEEIGRLSGSLKDAYAHYQNGTNDMIDYKRATIALNNATAQKKSAAESVKVKTAYLKQLMGYPGQDPLLLNSRIKSMEQDVLLDTLQILDVRERIEYQLLLTNIKLQKLRSDYYRLSFLPSLSAFVNYNYIYQNDAFSELYKRAYPNSTAGLTLSFPIFQGTKRVQNIRKSDMEYTRLALDTLNARNEMNSEYVGSIASYKSNLATYMETRENADIAREVYNIVKLQYNQGVKTYLEVIVSETDLMSARINNLNALFMLMFSKLDVQRALGQISVNY